MLIKCDTARTLCLLEFEKICSIFGLFTTTFLNAKATEIEKNTWYYSEKKERQKTWYDDSTWFGSKK